MTATLVTIAVRGVGSPRGGAIQELALQALNAEMEPTGKPMAWKVKAMPSTFTTAVAANEVNSIARLAALMAAEGSDTEGEPLSAVTCELEQWWNTEVGTDRFAARKPKMIAFRPDIVRLWLREHVPIIEELFSSDQIDATTLAAITTAWDCPHDAINPGFESVSDEVEAAADTVRYLRARLNCTKTAEPK